MFASETVYSCVPGTALIAAVPARTAVAKIITATPPRDKFNIKKSFLMGFALGAPGERKGFVNCGELIELEV